MCSKTRRTSWSEPERDHNQEKERQPQRLRSFIQRQKLEQLHSQRDKQYQAIVPHWSTAAILQWEAHEHLQVRVNGLAAKGHWMDTHVYEKVLETKTSLWTRQRRRSTQSSLTIWTAHWWRAQIEEHGKRQERGRQESEALGRSIARILHLSLKTVIWWTSCFEMVKMKKIIKNIWADWMHDDGYINVICIMITLLGKNWLPLPCSPSANLQYRERRERQPFPALAGPRFC